MLGMVALPWGMEPLMNSFHCFLLAFDDGSPQHSSRLIPARITSSEHSALNFIQLVHSIQRVSVAELPHLVLTLWLAIK